MPLIAAMSSDTDWRSARAIQSDAGAGVGLSPFTSVNGATQTRPRVTSASTVPAFMNSVAAAETASDATVANLRARIQGLPFYLVFIIDRPAYRRVSRIA